MKNQTLAVPVFNDRLSPLLDVADRFAIVDIVDNRLEHRAMITVNEPDERRRIEKLRELGVTCIISGAVSGYVSRLVACCNMDLISWVSGGIDDVLEAYMGGSLSSLIEAHRSCVRGTRRRCCEAGDGRRGPGSRIYEKEKEQ
jgi:predicted Fe-Mo cluster-binding NifX family protein